MRQAFLCSARRLRHEGEGQLRYYRYKLNIPHTVGKP